MSLRSLYVTMNADVLLTIGEKNSFVFRIKYDYSLHVKIRDGATETRLTLKNAFLYTRIHTQVLALLIILCSCILHLVKLFDYKVGDAFEYVIFVREVERRYLLNTLKPV